MTAEIAPPVAPATFRNRHVLVVLSFLLLVAAPVAASAWYLWTRAADQYASTVAFSVRQEKLSSAIEVLGGITDLSGTSASDADILYEFIQSQALVAQVDQRLNLRKIWSQTKGDPVFAFDPSGTIEDLQSHWKRKLRIAYDTTTGLIELQVLAFTPEDATAIAQAVLADSTAMINKLSEAAREDAIRHARAELDLAVTRLKAARAKLTRFRNQNQLVNPEADLQTQTGLLATLQSQLAESLIELDLLYGTTRENDPRIAQVRRRIDVIEDRITDERAKLGLGEGENGQAFATLVGEYETLVVDREFAEQSYTAALAAYDAAQAEARRQSRYLAAHILPTMAERAEYPQRWMLMITGTLFLFLSWATLVLIGYALRDRR
ncbi:capsule biosynthesis protein [Actibacterium pelagium]|uniref:Capsular polysaccharide transport system permease protein n=1 Tax=Actibacterium pelagium TaxID=2029103 RepID=A0A917EM44_9RHOB|nr:capsule biosynthesis protein [Actibacterium pelagium]GGE54942.1 hypothetical protein GCM10011517_23270 [Actibacterium pelagium]